MKRICTVVSSEQPEMGSVVENTKWESQYERQGWELFRCRGQVPADSLLDPDHLLLLPEISPQNQDNKSFMSQVLFTKDLRGVRAIRKTLGELSGIIYQKVRAYLLFHGIDTLHVDNLLSYPFCFPFAAAVAKLIEHDNIAVVARDHDFLWDDIPEPSLAMSMLAEDYLFPAHPRVLHVTLTEYSTSELARRRHGVTTQTIPNLFSFDIQPDRHRPAEFRSWLGLSQDDLLILQPTRLTPWKGIHHAVQLAAMLGLETGRRPFVVVTGRSIGGFGITDSWQRYELALEALANQLGIGFLKLERRLASCRYPEHPSGFCMTDAYLAADLVTFPSTIEGFGNPVIESIAAKRPLFTARYPVMKREFLARGLEFVCVDADPVPAILEFVLDRESSPDRGMGGDFDITQRRIQPEHVKATLDLLVGRAPHRNAILDRNWQIAFTYYSDRPHVVQHYFSPLVEWISTGVT